MTETSASRKAASALKLKARRLALLTDDGQPWEATLALHDAARIHLTLADALIKEHSVAAIEELVEACGLFAECGDPRSAASTASRLRRYVGKREAKTKVLEMAAELTAKETAFARSIRSRIGVPERFDVLTSEEVAFVMHEFPGWSGTWWIAFRSGRGDRASSRMYLERAVALTPTSHVYAAVLIDHMSDEIDGAEALATVEEIASRFEGRSAEIMQTMSMVYLRYWRMTGENAPSILHKGLEAARRALELARLSAPYLVASAALTAAYLEAIEGGIAPEEFFRISPHVQGNRPSTVGQFEQTLRRHQLAQVYDETKQYARP